MWSDNDTKIDFLNFEDTVESVVHILTRADLKPMSLGLFGAGALESRPFFEW